MRANREPWRSVRFAVVAVALSALVACNQADLSPGPSGSGPLATQGGPASSDAPPGAAASSQELIAADLGAGTIDLGTALTYRAWALFWDPRLPERYDGTGSTGEDPSLFDDIAEALPGLPTEQRAAVEGYLLRPTESGSPFAPADTATISYAALTAAEGEAEPARCSTPREWIPDHWSPDGTADSGFTAWVCAPSKATARGALDRVLAVGAKLWPRMTAAVPGGMGPPMPDTTARSNEGNGKIDVYVLDAQAECRMRGLSCTPIPGDSVAAATMGYPKACGAPGFPSSGCTGYMLLARDRLDDATFASDFAHEFFHVLQYAHNGLKATWYHEASAQWAEWHYERDLAEPNAYGNYSKYQEANRSLLWFDESTTYQYQAWVWPLFQETKLGPSGIFGSWKGIEGAGNATELDQAVDAQLPFVDEFRNFAVRNAQPASYLPPDSTGLDDESWQKVQRPGLANFPVIPHKASDVRTIGVGKTTVGAEVDPLAAQYDVFDLTADAVRQITIDISGLKGASDADLDVLGRLNPVKDGPKDPWRRERGSAGKLTLCRDVPDENYNLLHVVISNHAVGRDGNLPDFQKTVKGDYTIETKDKCDVPDGYDGTFNGSDSRGNTWHGTAKFDREVPDPRGSECRNDGRTVEYCYSFVSGEATWAHSGQSCSGGPVSVALSKGTSDDGILQLRIREEGRPERDQTYRIILGAGDHTLGSCIAAYHVIAWIHTATPQPIGGGYALAGTKVIEGCGPDGCGSQTWTWALQPRFDD